MKLVSDAELAPDGVSGPSQRRMEPMMELHQRTMADLVIPRLEVDTAMRRLNHEVMAMPNPGVNAPRAQAKPAKPAKPAAAKPKPAKAPAKKKPPAKPMPPMPGMKHS